MDQTKQYPASRKKSLKARKDGDVAKSTLITQLSGTVAVFGSFLVQKEALFRFLGYFEQSFGSLADFQSNNMLLCVSAFFELLVEIVVPSLLAAVIAGIAAEIFQVGFHFLPGQLNFRISRLNPVSGFRRMVGLDAQDSNLGSAFRRMLYGTLKLAFLGVGIPLVAVISVFGIFSSFESLYASAIGELMLALCSCAVRLIASVLCFLTPVAFCDLLVQRHKRLQRLRMSAEELNREIRENEGDPEIQAQRRQIREEMAFNEILEGVRRAAVVVVNS